MIRALSYSQTAETKGLIKGQMNDQKSLKAENLALKNLELENTGGKKTLTRRSKTKGKDEQLKYKKEA